MTQLHVEQIEAPPSSKRGLFEIEFVKKRNFHGDKIVVDNRQFEDCHFVNCHFVYFGGHFAFADCTVEGSCQFSPVGAAYRTMNLYDALKPAIQAGQPPY